MNRSAKVRKPARASHCVRACRLQLLALEARLPLGDALLGLMAGSWLLGAGGNLPGARLAAVESSPGNTVMHRLSASTPFQVHGDAGALTSAFPVFAGDLFEAPLSDFTGAFAGQAPKPSREPAGQAWLDEAFSATPATAPRETVAPVSSQTGSAARGESSLELIPVRHGTQGDTTSNPLLTTAAASPDAALLATVAQVEARPSAGPAGSKQPNIVFIMTDDQDLDTLQYMPRLHALL